MTGGLPEFPQRSAGDDSQFDKDTLLPKWEQGGGCPAARAQPLERSAVS